MEELTHSYKVSGAVRYRNSCDYHHRRHQACPQDCEGRQTHPQGRPHPPIQNKFAVGCAACMKHFGIQPRQVPLYAQFAYYAQYAQPDTCSSSSSTSCSSSATDIHFSPYPPPRRRRRNRSATASTTTTTTSVPQTMCIDQPPSHCTSECSCCNVPIFYQQPCQQQEESAADIGCGDDDDAIDEDPFSDEAELIEEGRQKVQQIRDDVAQEEAVITYQMELQHAEAWRIEQQRMLVVAARAQLEQLQVSSARRGFQVSSLPAEVTQIPPPEVAPSPSSTASLCFPPPSFRPLSLSRMLSSFPPPTVCDPLFSGVQLESEKKPLEMHAHESAHCMQRLLLDSEAADHSPRAQRARGGHAWDRV